MLLFVDRNGSILKTFVRTDHRKLKNKGFLYFFFTLLGFWFLFRGIYYITPHSYSLFEKLVAAFIVTGECGVKQTTLNTRSRGKQLVLFSPESFPMFPETKSRENKTNWFPERPDISVLLYF